MELIIKGQVFIPTFLLERVSLLQVLPLKLIYKRRCWLSS